MKYLSKAATILKTLCILALFSTPSSYTNFGFIIPTYVTTETHKIVLRECLRKIRLYHANPIVLINDHSPLDISEIQKEFANVSIESSMIKGAGEMNPYLHFYAHKYFDTAIILHDSMHLNKPLERVDSIQDIKFIRYFTNHIFHWNLIQEPKTYYNEQHGIIVHDDLIIHLLKRILSEKNKLFLNFCLERYAQKKQWVGCFGIQTIITHNFLKELHNKTNILDFATITNNRRSRCAMESIFALACHYLRDTEYLKNNAYDGLYFDGITPGKLVTENFNKISLGR